MPCSELHRMAKGKLESTQSKMTNYSADIAFPNDSDIIELVWENGQILMQGQTSRNRKSPSKEKDGGDVVNPKIGRFGTVDSVFSNFPSMVPSGQLGLDQDDDIVPWLNCHLDDSLQHDYCSELFSELTGTNLNSISTQNNSVPISRISNFGHVDKDPYMVSNNGGLNQEQGNASKVFGDSPEPARPRINQLYRSPMEDYQTSVPSFGSSDSDFHSHNNHQAAFLNSSQNPNLTLGSPNTTMQMQDLVPIRPLPQPCNTTGLMNFSHFSRTAALVKANLQSIDTTGGFLNIDRLRSSGNESGVGSSNPVESTLIESNSGSKSVTDFQSQPVSLPTKVVEEPPSAEQFEAICQEDASRINGSPPDQGLGHTSSVAASIAIGRQDREKVIEPAVASSSVCSGNSGGEFSNDPRHNSKRKSRDTEESEYQSDDIEEDSLGARKTGPARGGAGAKRSRAAEVHNLSERRRRDRINEKMRALQELIPNCNKVDKASMLDEAIEYLKALQLQVQIMSMGTGLCMPPMMLPTGLQHMHASHMGRFSPMDVGMGMGMGMGFGMGMFDMSGGGYSGRPWIQVPSIHGTQFPGQPISGPTSLPTMAGSGLPMFGGFPSQGLTMSMPHAPFIPLSGGPYAESVSMVNVSGTGASVELPDSAPMMTSSKGPNQNLKSPTIHKKSTDGLQNQTSPQTIRKGVEQSALVEKDDQTPHISSNGAVDSTGKNRIESSKATEYDR